MDVRSTATLNNGIKMPWLGLGVWQSREGEEAKNAVKRERIAVNADVFDFMLSGQGMSIIDSMNKDRRTGRNPGTFAK